MKKIILIVLLIAFIATAAAIFLLRSGPPANPIESVLPSGPLAYLRVTALDKNWQDFTSTQFYQTLAQVDWGKALKEAGVSAQDLAAFEEFKKQLANRDTQNLVKRFLGQEFAVAVYPVDFSQVKVADPSELFSKVFFVTRLQAETKMADLVTALAKPFLKDVSIETAPYREHTIHLIKAKNGPLQVGFAAVGDFFVVGMGDRPARACIDLVADKAPGLAGDPLYLSTRSTSQKGEVVSAFANFDLLIKHLKDQLLKLAAQQGDKSELIQAQVEQNIKQMAGFRAVRFSLAADQITRFKFDVYFDKPAMHPDLAAAYSTPGRKNDSLRYVPSDVLGYQWSAGYNFTLMWKKMQEEMARIAGLSPDQPDPRQKITQAENDFGLSITSDVVPALGEEIGGYLADIDTQGIFPVPKLLLFVEIKDPAKAEKVMAALLRQQPIFRPEEETYQNVRITFLTVPVVTAIQPAYALVGKYLLITTSLDLIKRSVDASLNGDLALTANPELKEIDAGLTEAHNSVMFFQVNRLAGKIGDMIAWGGRWAETQASKQGAFISGSTKKLADSRKDTEAKQAELADLEKKLAEVEAQKAEKGAREAEAEKFKSTVEQLERFAKGMNDSLAQTRSEVKKLTAIEDAPDTMLPPEGIERLRQLEDEIRKKEQKLIEVEAEIIQTKKARDEMVALMDQRRDLQAAVAAKKKEIQTGQDMEKDIQSDLTGYEASALDLEKRRAMVDGLVNPLVKAFTFIRGFAARMTVQDNVLRSETFLRLQ